MISIQISLYLLITIASFLQLSLVWGGQELVHNFQLAPDDLRPHDIAIIQFETRTLKKRYKSAARWYDNNYWNVSARWNKVFLIIFCSWILTNGHWPLTRMFYQAYAQRHGHQFAFIALHPKNECRTASHALSAVWCKVIAMIRAHDLLPKAKASASNLEFKFGISYGLRHFCFTQAFLYLDSDAVMTTNYSLSDIVGFVRRELKWDMMRQPMAFNQDGPGWACKHTMKYSYPYCLNSGTLFWWVFRQCLDISRTYSIFVFYNPRTDFDWFRFCTG